MLVEMRIQSTLSVSLSLQDFPFDTQAVKLEVESPNHPYEEMQFVPKREPDLIAIMKPLTEWDTVGAETQLTTNYYSIFHETYSRLDYIIHIRRKPQFYMDKVVVGIVMLVIMTWLLFCLPTEDSNRQTAAATTFLAVVGYISVATADAPKVPYTTRLGKFINLSTAQILVSFVVFSIDAIINRTANAAEEDAIAGAKSDRQAKIRELRHKQKTLAPTLVVPMDHDLEDTNPSTTKGRNDENNCVDAMLKDGLDEDIEVEGWWDTWRMVRYKIDLVIVFLMVLSYGIACPLILRHT